MVVIKMRFKKQSQQAWCCYGESRVARDPALAVRAASDSHHLQLHDAHTVAEDVGGGPQQPGKGIQCVVLERRASHLAGDQTPLTSLPACGLTHPQSRLPVTLRLHLCIS